MDAKRFDAMTKVLHVVSTRRRVIGSLTFGTLAWTLGWHEASAARCAKEGQKPKGSRKPCCGPLTPGPDGRCGPAEPPPPGGLACGAICDPIDPTGPQCAEAPCSSCLPIRVGEAEVVFQCINPEG